MIAHSSKNEIPNQSYREHVRSVRDKGLRFANDALKYYDFSDKEYLLNQFKYSLSIHDIGKLSDINQEVLNGQNQMMHPHAPIAAGISMMQNKWLASCLTFWHHSGLKDFRDGFKFPLYDNGKYLFDNWNAGHPVSEYIDRHNSNVDEEDQINTDLSSIPNSRDNSYPFPKKNGANSFLLRLMMSCMVDADHSDTARHYQGIESKPDTKPDWDSIIDFFEDYMYDLQLNGKKSKRNELRRKLFKACSKTLDGNNLLSAPVGSGKTLAALYAALLTAREKGLRRIIWVVPFTNVVNQTTLAINKALGQGDGEIIAVESHSRTDYTEDNIAPTLSWNAPIVVTTAVKFFGLLASCKTRDLERFHRIPGSFLVFDEYHSSALLKLKHWRIASWWLNILNQKASCHSLFVSGTPARFWDIDDLSEEKMRLKVNNIINTESDLQKELDDYERNRVNYKTLGGMTFDRLIEHLNASPSSLIVFNTVKASAIFAKRLQSRNIPNVFYISTAMTGEHRKEVINNVRARLEKGAKTILVSTSAVECGVDVSFEVGYRERFGMDNIMQLSGRVNRNGELDHAIVYDFLLDEEINQPTYAIGISRTFSRIIEDNGIENISPSLYHEFVENTMGQNGDVGKHFLEWDVCFKFRTLMFGTDQHEGFSIIQAQTRTIIVDPELVKKVEENGLPLSLKDIDRGCVRVWDNRFSEIHNNSGLRRVKTSFVFENDEETAEELLADSAEDYFTFINLNDDNYDSLIGVAKLFDDIDDV